MPSSKSSHKSSISRSSTDSNISYLHAVWKGRVDLKTPERTGFAQSFYILISTHVESLLFALIDIRLETVKRFARDAMHDLAFRLAHSKTNDQATFEAGKAESHPAFYSIHKITDRYYDNLQNAPVSRLIQLYDSIFPIPFGKVIGNELKKDLDALMAMRNIFAHGRRIGIEFDGPMDSLKVDFDSSTLKVAADRLRRANLLSTVIPISSRTYLAWESSFFSDDTLLYFYNSVVQIDDKLKSCPYSFSEAKIISQMPGLPVLAKD